MTDMCVRVSARSSHITARITHLSRILVGLGSKPTIPSEEASKLKKENSALRKENEKLLLDFLSLQEEASAEDETNKEEKLAAIKLYKSFKRGGAREMATEVRNVVSESGKLLRKIQDYEGRSECGGGGGGFEDSVATR